MSNEIAQVNLNDPDNKNESNNEQNIKMREEASEAHSRANKNSRKKDSDKKRRFDDLVNYMMAMQVNNEAEEGKKIEEEKKSDSKDDEKSVDLKSIIRRSKASIPIDDDRLIEVQVSVPHLQKTPTLHSQNLADNTLFIDYLAKQQSFVNKNALVGQWNSESKKKKDLKTLAAELSQKHTTKKSGNLTTEMIQSRFGVTDLNELEEELNKNKKESSAEKTENEETDSDFNPDEPEMLGDEESESESESDNEPTFSGNPESGVESKQNYRSKGKRALDIDDIRRLEEGDDDEGEEEEKAENLESNKSDDVDAFDEVQEQEVEGRQREFRKTFGITVLEKMKMKEKQKREKEKRKAEFRKEKEKRKAELRKEKENRRAEERKSREKATREMGTEMEVEAELDCDNEGNDDFRNKYRKIRMIL